MAVRRNSLTPKLLKEIVKGVERTTTIEFACSIARISESVFYKWQSIGREQLELVNDNDDYVVPPELEIFVELVESVEDALNLSCLPAVDTINKAIKNGDVRAAEKLLARRKPKLWGDYDRKEVTVKSDSQVDDGTGIGMTPYLVDGQDLDQLLQQQQSDALLLAKTRTDELS
jgi:hypothetical protein